MVCEDGEGFFISIFKATSESHITFTHTPDGDSYVPLEDIVEAIKMKHTINPRGQYVFAAPINVSA